jgi:hypothetical protein
MCVHRCAGHDDLRAFWIDSLDSGPLPVSHFCQPPRKLFHDGQGDTAPLRKMQ